MLNLDPDEKIQLVMHHHWIFIVGEAVLTFFLASLPFIAGPFFLLFVKTLLVLGFSRRKITKR